MEFGFFSDHSKSAVAKFSLPVSEIPTILVNPLGGRLKYCTDSWEKINPSDWVKGVVSDGYKIPFETKPMQRDVPINPVAKDEAFKILESEAADLVAKSAVVECVNEPEEYISTYFAVAKARSPGKFRPILNLKRFNKNIRKFKFKMETLGNVRDWLHKGGRLFHETDGYFHFDEH